MRTSINMLRELIPFDAVQLLRIESQGRPQEIFRQGYSSNTAWALAHMFPQKYPHGFTRYASADPPLPATISTSLIQGEFTSSTLFREHLSREGYAEGMSLELHSGSGTVGLAHFSSRRAAAFSGEPRKAALAVSGLLGQLVALHPARKNNPWPISSHSGIEEALLADPQFLALLEQFKNSPLAMLEHLWWAGDCLVEVGITQPGNLQARPAPVDKTAGLSRQELAVLSVLCCGVSDAEVANRLHLSIRTVQSHISSLRKKLNASSRLEAVVIALGRGLYIPHPRLAPLEQIARGSGR